MIKTVIFDLDNTLFSYERGHHDGLKALCAYGEKELGISSEEVLRCYGAVLLEIQERLGFHNSDIHNRVMRFARMLEIWEKPLFPHVQQMCQAYWEPMMAACELMPGVMEFLQYAKRKGYVLGVGSDMTSYVQYEKLKRLGIGPYLDFVVTSEEAGVEKPHPNFFAWCLKKAGVKPEEAIFIGDHVQKDVAGATRNGLHGIWYWPGALLNEENNFWPEGLKEPEEMPAGVDLYISHYGELSGIIEKLDADDPFVK